jgi:hypothetical protein
MSVNITLQEALEMAEHTKYLSQQEVANILKVKVKTLNQWRFNQKRKIPCTKIGRIILYPEDLFFAWLQNQSLPVAEYKNV